MSYSSYSRPERTKSSRGNNSSRNRNNNRGRNFSRNNRGRGRGGFKGKYIDPSKFVSVATQTEKEEYVANNTFDDFGLDQIVTDNLKRKGYEVPSPIQDQAIAPALSGVDVIGIAGTGTGKTAAFLLPTIQRLLTGKATAVLIVAPTRELAQQIQQECRTFTQGHRLYQALLIGGSSMGRQIHDLKGNPKIVIGTPGRISDHIRRRTLRLANFDVAVLDEVDRMLDMGFVDDVTQILGQMKPDRQSLLFSATMDKRVRGIIDRFSSDPIEITIKASSASENVHQDVLRFSTNNDKLDQLHEVLNKEEVAKVIVFDETQRGVERLGKELHSRGFSVDYIHGGKSQGQRHRAMRKFKASEVDILVATDVAARGIDVDDISHVINFSIPKAYDDYIHRIGRAGRAGKVGYALTFVSQ